MSKRTHSPRARRWWPFVALAPGDLDPIKWIPEEGHLHLVRGIAVSRPNLLLGVAEADLGRFFADWRGLRANGSNWREFVDRYGVRRADPWFWRAFDFSRTRSRRSTLPSQAYSTCRGYGND
jgi:hypothetical protein